MSKEITCKECGYTNPYSSKFCNNCGAKLPLSTHIICPNCETPNTRDRVFCDTCGTRLIAETTKLKPEEPPPPPPPQNQPFSLPTRRPGETGELNPKAVPDWLRTGDIGSAKDNEEAANDKTEKKGGSDLPEWLMHDSDPEPIINAPTTISTEFYQDLLSKADDLPQPDDLFGDEDEANLPDWLSDTGLPPQEPGVRSGLTDWLSDLSDDADDVGPAEVTDEAEDLSSGLTDWLQELDDMGDTADAHQTANAAALDDLLDDVAEEETAESDDWLQELGPAQTDMFATRTEAPAETDDDELPGWMDELGPLQTNLLDPGQMAQLTGPLVGVPDDDLLDDEAAGADVSFTQLFETSRDATEKLPDWLDAAAEEGTAFLADLPDEAELAEADEEPEVVSEPGSDWFTVDQIVAETDLDWLEETGNLETVADDAVLNESGLFGVEAADTDLDWLEETGNLETVADDAVLDESGLFGVEAADDEVDNDFLLDEFALDEFVLDDTAVSDEFSLSADEEDGELDWLSDMEAIQTGELVIAPEPEPDEPTEPPIAEAELADVAEAEIEPEPEPDAWASETFLPETAVNEDLPDWLEQLDEPQEGEEPAFADPQNEELPDWIASMRPGGGVIGSELPGVFSEIDLRDTLEGIPEELAGAELPDWLQGAPLESSPLPVSEAKTEAPLEIPDWLQPNASEPGQSAAAKPASEPVPSGSSRQEWRSLLDELPPLTPLAQSLPKAEIPEWVQQLKPPELTGDVPREPEGPAEVSGPLKGMHGIVPIEPVIARPRAATLPTPYVTTPEQQQQVALLKQLAQEMPDTVTTLSAKPAYDTAVWLRLSLAFLLIVALLAGLLGPSLVATDAEVPAHVQAVETAVAAAAGQPVLLAIEYTPAMAGELSPQAKLLLERLIANGSPVLITSQYAAGTAVARDLVADQAVQFVGYLPGEGIGLRQLGDCLAGQIACEQLNGRTLDTEIQANLSQTALVIVLTGDRDNLVNWIEQIGAVATELPLVAGVTQALTPLANSYAAAGQVDGLLGGMPDTAVYEQLTNVADGPAQTQLNAQIYGQLLAGLLLLIGLLIYGTTGAVRNRRTRN
ncbi:MAG: zinc ribbon domain-containing protein [Chloroflexota bacterium]